jgi:phenylalanyl-tRNA synthetase beta chain
MLVPEKWLREYVDLEGIDGKTLADELTMSGSHVDSIIHVDKGVNKVVVGKILEILPHPDADKLQICKIDVGEEVLQIVTGAQNVCVNNFVPVALVGSKLPDGTKIKKGKLRGVESFGMLCSTDELGIPENVVEKGGRDGIYILDKEYTLGMDIKDALKLNGSIIEVINISKIFDT